MKSFIVAIIITVFMVTGSVIYTMHINHLSELIINENNNAIAYIENKEFDRALAHIDIMLKDIESRRILLAMTLDHTEIDKIESNLAEMKEFAKAQNKTDALAKASALNIHLKHLPQNYRLKIENIL